MRENGEILLILIPTDSNGILCNTRTYVTHLFKSLWFNFPVKMFQKGKKLLKASDNRFSHQEKGESR